MQVSLLKLNSGISRAVETTATLERQNGALENAIGRLGATTRIQTGAKSLGLVMPAPADVTYLRSRSSDPERALRVMTAPSDEAAALMANNGIVPGSLVATAGAPAGRPRRAATAAAGDRDDDDAPQPATATGGGAGAPRRPPRSRPPRPPRPSPRSRGARRAPHRTALRRLPHPAHPGRAARRLARPRARGHACRPRPPRSRRPTSPSPPAAARSPTRRAPSWPSPGPAATVTATPYLVKDPAKAASVLARTLKVPEDELLRKLARRDTGFVYLARHVPSRRADRARGLKHRRRRLPAGVPARLPAHVDGLAAARQRRHRREGPVRARVRARPPAARRRRRAQARQGRAGRRDRAARRRPHAAGRGRQAHARRQHPGRGRAGARPGRAGVEAQGRHRARDEPAGRVRAGARQLAARRRQPPVRRAGLRDDEPGHGRDLRARLDVQGVHRGRRDRGGQGAAGHGVRPRADDHRGRPRDRRVARARLRDPHHGRDPQAVLQRRRGDDRAAPRRRPLRSLGPALRLRQAHGRRPAGRGVGPAARPQGLLGLEHGQHADRPGPVRHADADGRRLQRDRQRRHPARRRASSSRSAAASARWPRAGA